TAEVSGTAGLEEVAGDRVVVVSVERAQVPADGYLEAWLTDSGVTRLQALGALRRDGAGWTGRFVLPDGLPLDQLDSVDVSVEHYDGDPSHSGDSLLRGRLS
ncbi:anti-sigma factor domain-containing protein, partial [Pseudonocardia pini]|uniref:anti-sigma factor domain-containing protein n=1 Tax=Pseudonocardia pini TaxID=2758030 RepID=UPI0015F0254A